MPTRLVGLDQPNPESGVTRPEEGERLRLRDIADVSDDARVAKALRRLATVAASDSLSQLVMWRVAAGLEWETIEELSSKWANRYELTLAKAFVDRLDSAATGESGRLLFEVAGSDAATAELAASVRKELSQKVVLGLQSEVGIPANPVGPSVACRVKIGGDNAVVQVMASDALAQHWVAFGKFKLPVTVEAGKFDARRFALGLAEGILGRLVRS